MRTTYAEPVSMLLSYGDCLDSGEWPNYLELGFTREHIPELIRMATDEELNWADSDSLEVWAPMHAWRGLGQLHAEEAIEPLMRLFHELEHVDWVGEELPIVYQMLGPPAVPALAGYLAEDSHALFALIAAAESIERIGIAYPGAKEPCSLALLNQLECYRDNDPTLNAVLINNLVDLQSIESLPLIGQAFDDDVVDLMVAGDLEDAEIRLKVREHRSTPARSSPLRNQILALLEESDFPQRLKTRKIGRNELCPCGSAKKYKKCCLSK